MRENRLAVQLWISYIICFCALWCAFVFIYSEMMAFFTRKNNPFLVGLHRNSCCIFFWSVLGHKLAAYDKVKVTNIPFPNVLILREDKKRPRSYLEHIITFMGHFFCCALVALLRGMCWAKKPKDSFKCFSKRYVGKKSWFTRFNMDWHFKLHRIVSH